MKAVFSSGFTPEYLSYLSKVTDDLDNLRSYTWPRNQIPLYFPNLLLLSDIQISANGPMGCKSQNSSLKCSLFKQILIRCHHEQYNEPIKHAGIFKTSF